jgi:hypothetical protein
MIPMWKEYDSYHVDHTGTIPRVQVIATGQGHSEEEALAHIIADLQLKLNRLVIRDAVGMELNPNT